jgi:hypothetical protein
MNGPIELRRAGKLADKVSRRSAGYPHTLKSVPQYYKLGKTEGLCMFYVLRVVLRGRYR